ncbi:hypothetical protein GALMADRAFT_146974 [Galerina marginata CBS 339.88]|uniref:Uncharacterized protein n=1 Tax=Galerina marginata (strain CBS 339.88) TaxID=685588 RepID=A0A067S9W7_GALM3|nr:hypothetical protein GALMADRAFT_146974 [Galerina marginata CBS 339.88]
MTPSVQQKKYYEDRRLQLLYRTVVLLPVDTRARTNGKTTITKVFHLGRKNSGLKDPAPSQIYQACCRLRKATHQIRRFQNYECDRSSHKLPVLKSVPPTKIAQEIMMRSPLAGNPFGTAFVTCMPAGKSACLKYKRQNHAHCSEFRQYLHSSLFPRFEPSSPVEGVPAVSLGRTYGAAYLEPTVTCLTRDFTLADTTSASKLSDGQYCWDLQWAEAESQLQHLFMLLLMLLLWPLSNAPSNAIFRHPSSLRSGTDDHNNQQQQATTATVNDDERRQQ